MNMHVRASSIDPIFALIEASRTIRATYADWCDQDTPEAAEWARTENAALDALFKVRPTTIAGVKALAGYFREIAEGWQADTQFLAAIEAACGHLTAAAAAVEAIGRSAG